MCAGIMGDAETAILTTVDDGGYPNSRAMLNLRNERQFPGLAAYFAGEADKLAVMFTTNTSSIKVRQLAANPKAAAYYTVPAVFRGVMIAGDLELVDDDAVKHALWQEGWTIYYPEGKNDPDYSILRLVPRFIRGWAGFAPFTLEI